MREDGRDLRGLHFVEYQYGMFCVGDVYHAVITKGRVRGDDVVDVLTDGDCCCHLCYCLFCVGHACHRKTQQRQCIP